MPELAESDADPYVPPGRPVPRFVAGIVVVAAALVAIALVGPLRADLDVTVPQWEVRGDRALSQIAITNAGRFPVDVTGIGGAGLREPSTIDNVRVDAGETVTITATLVLDCEQHFGGFGPPLEIEAEVLLGLERTVQVGLAMDSLADTVCNPT